MPPVSTVRLRKALAPVVSPADTLDDALLTFLVETLKGEDGLGVEVDFAADVLLSFLPLWASAGSPELARAAIAAARGIGGADAEAVYDVTGLDGNAAGGGSASDSAGILENGGDISALLQAFPALGLDGASLALERAGGDVERAAALALADEGVSLAAEATAAATARKALAARRAAAAAAEEANTASAKRAMLARFGEVADDGDVVHRPTVAVSAARKKGERVMRYVDGVPVFLPAGEKFIVEKAPDTAGSFVSLKIKKKGSGGPSPGFK